MRLIGSISVFALLGASLGAMTYATTASAVEPRDAAAAEVLFRRAKELQTQGDVPRACGLFAESLRLDPATGTLLNLAACEERLGKLASAWQHFVDARASLPPGDFRMDFADKRIAALEPRVPKLTLSLSPAATGIPRVQVMRGEIELGAPSLGVALPTDPGEHVIVVRAPDRAEFRTVVSLAEAEQRVVLVEVGAPLPTPATRSEATVDGDSTSSRRTVGYVVAGTGALSLALGVVAGVVTLDAAARYEKSCTSEGACSPRGLDAADTGKTFEVVSPIALGVGAAALAVGVYLVLTSSKAPARGALLVAPTSTQGGVGMSFRKTF